MKNIILKQLGKKEFYKHIWHRILIAPILALGIYASSIIYILSGGFHLIFYTGLLVGITCSFLFVLNYNKHYVFILLFLLFIQILTVNINTREYEYYVPNHPIGEYSSEKYGDKYYDISAFCLGLHRNYYESTYCVGIPKNCIIKTLSKTNHEVINTKPFPCTEYKSLLKEKQEFFNHLLPIQ